MKVRKVEEILRQYIEEHNITIKDISKLIGKNRNTVASILKGESSIDVNSLTQICKEYKIPLSHFIIDDEKIELLDDIEILTGHINRLEFYLSSFILQEIENEKSAKPTVTPDSIYDYPKIIQLAKQYDLFQAHSRLGILAKKPGDHNIKGRNEKPFVL